MAAAKKKTTRSRAQSPTATAAGRFTVLLEQIQEQNRATIEAVHSLDQKMMRRFEETDERNERRFQALMAAVQLNSELIRTNTEAIRKNSEDIRRNTEVLSRHGDELSRLSGAVESMGGELKLLARRVERLEEVLGLKADAALVANLDARIRRLEERLGLSPL